MINLNDQIAELQGLTPAQTRSEWRRLFRRDVPEHSPHLLKRAIAWKLQARVEGGLSPPILRSLDRLVQINISDQNSTARTSLDIPVGTKLIREWNDRMIEVLVTNQGYEYAGRHYRSLSQIARHVTGVQWSGPRFFGLVKRKQYQKVVNQ